MPFLVNSRYLGRVWLANVRASIVREMEFRGNFIMGLIRQLLWLGAFLLLIELIFYNTTSLAGWNREEVLIVLGLSRLIEGFMGVVFVGNIIRISDLVQKGTFDFILARPLPKQFSAFFSRVDIGAIGNTLAGIAVVAYALVKLPGAVSFTQLGLALLLAALGITIYYSLLVSIASLVFYIERIESLWSFNNLFSEPLTVPFDVLPRGPRIALTYFLPIAFVVFVPAQALTERFTWSQLPFAIGITVVFFAFANLVWRAGLRRYSSASS